MMDLNQKSRRTVQGKEESFSNDLNKEVKNAGKKSQGIV